MTKADAKPSKRSQTKLLFLAFLTGFVLIELGIGLSFYIHEANHNNDSLDVLFGSLEFALIFALPAGIIVSLIVWGIQTLRLNGGASKP